MSIIHCPECGYLMSTNIGCTQCHPQEVKRRKSKTQARKVEGPTGEDMPSPAVQEMNSAQKERT